VIGTLNPAFEGSFQQDAEEFLTFLINQLHNELKVNFCQLYNEAQFDQQ